MGVGDIQQASRGSSVLVDNIRWQSYLAGMTALEAKTYGISDDVRGQFVRFGINKVNYGERAPDRWLQRHEGGVLKITALSSKNNKSLLKKEHLPGVALTMTTGNKVAPTSTAWQARVILYQPSQRPKEVKGQWMETSFGRCRVTGRLGQRHADIVETILYVAEQRREISDGGIELLVDPAKVRRTLSDAQYSYGRIQKLLLDLRVATVEIITPELGKNGDCIIGGLIDHVVPSPMTRPDPLTGGERRLWRVRLGVALAMLLKKDLPFYYHPGPHSSATTWY
ncbi:replication protein A [Klebsiella quasipneumoniae]|nr:replication protein A [Klebsiella quasipneumoniae]